MEKDKKKIDPDVTVSNRRAPTREESSRAARERAAQKKLHDELETEELHESDDEASFTRDEPTLAGRPRAKLMDPGRKPK